MRKMVVVFKREYLQAVRKKMFIIMTFLFPALMAGLMVIPSMLMMRGLGEKRVAVLDGTGVLHDAYVRSAEPEPAQPKSKSPLKQRELPTSIKIEYVDSAKASSLDAAAKPYLSRLTQDDKKGQLDGVLVVPTDAMANSSAHLKYYSRSATDFISQERMASMTNHAVERYRLQTHGVKAEDLDKLLSEMTLDAVQLSKTGEETKGGSENFIVGFVLCALLILPTLIYGMEIMRGIIQEKTDRVVEVLISSVTPSQLLVGKIMGVAAVGLTQISVWLVMIGLFGAYSAATAMMAGVNVMQFVHPSMFIYFAVFFVLAYMTYVCIYAIGGAVCNSEKEAQQLIAPITMVMMLPWFMLVALITNPDSSVATGLSLAPIFGPMTMFIRTLVSDPPMVQVAISIVVSIATIALFMWITAKIFRVGILSYGKRPTIPELIRWVKVA